MLFLKVGQNKDGLEKINHVLGRSDGVRNFGSRQGVTYPIGSNGFYRLVTTNVGREVVDYLLAHRYSQRHIVAAIMVVNLHQDGFPSLLFAIAPDTEKIRSVKEANQAHASTHGDQGLPHALLPFFDKATQTPLIQAAIPMGSEQQAASGSQGGSKRPASASPPSGSKKKGKSKAPENAPDTSNQASGSAQGSSTAQIATAPGTIQATVNDFLNLLAQGRTDDQAMDHLTRAWRDTHHVSYDDARAEIRRQLVRSQQASLPEHWTETQKEFHKLLSDGWTRDQATMALIDYWLSANPGRNRKEAMDAVRHELDRKPG